MFFKTTGLQNRDGDPTGYERHQTHQGYHGSRMGLSPMIRSIFNIESTDQWGDRGSEHEEMIMVRVSCQLSVVDIAVPFSC